MDTTVWASWGRAMPRWLRDLVWPARGGETSEAEAALLWFGTGLIRGLVILVPVVVLISVAFAVDDHPLGLALMIIVAFSFFGYLIALLPAFTGALLVLPLVWWSARRWPRAGRVIAIVCAPVMGLGTLPFWEMWRMVEMWQMWVPVTAGVLAWAATLPLPPAARDAE